jgi:hypothetical protein
MMLSQHCQAAVMPEMAGRSALGRQSPSLGFSVRPGDLEGVVQSPASGPPVTLDPWANLPDCRPRVWWCHGCNHCFSQCLSYLTNSNAKPVL